jgi:hypothetical protein
MRRSSLDDEAIAAAAAAAPDAVTAEATECPLEPTPAALVDGYLSHSADLYSTYTRVYDRLTMFYQDNRAGEDVYMLPGNHVVLPGLNSIYENDECICRAHTRATMIG